MGKTELSDIKGKEAYVDFQKKDTAGTVLYSWEFYGTDVKSAEDMDLTIDMGNTPFEDCKYGSSSNSLYLAFSHKGELPGTAVINVKVAEWFDDSEQLNLYRYEDGEVTLEEENLKIVNGYVEFETDETSDYILTTEKFDAKKADTKSKTKTKTSEKKISGNDASDEVTDEVQEEVLETTEDSGNTAGFGLAAVLIVVIVAAFLKKKVLKH
jgi:hypothetical protein